MKLLVMQLSPPSRHSIPLTVQPLGKSKRRWVDNINIDFGEIGWSGLDRIILLRDRDKWRALVNVVMNLRAS
jgi:trehalose-6-phosphate synthase